MLESLLRDAGVEPEPALARLREYASLLIHWNHTVSNLVSHNDEHRFVERHLGESLGPLKVLRDASIERWMDIGSGGGLPAIPLAIAGVGREWVLVESRRMKTLFLQKVKQELKLDHVQVVCARIEKLDPAEPVGAVTSRATLRLGPTLSEAARFVVKGGKAFLWKGERRSGEMADNPAWQADWTVEETIELRGTPTVVVSLIRN